MRPFSNFTGGLADLFSLLTKLIELFMQKNYAKMKTQGFELVSMFMDNIKKKFKKGFIT
jgi:hypothetical protein